MTDQSSYLHYIQALRSNVGRGLATVACLGMLLSVPAKQIYFLPNLQQKNPILSPVNFHIPTPYPYPVNMTQAPDPWISAYSAIVIDVPSKAVLFMKNPNTRLYPASTTKMMTGLLVTQLYNLDTITTIQTPPKEGQVMDLVTGEQISIRNLLYGTLIYSANDAAEVLAELHPEGRLGFIEAMNSYVTQLGLQDTHFENPTGLDHYNHYSSVHDLSILGAELMQNPELKEMVAIKDLVVTDVTGEILHPLKNVNQLLGTVVGMKGIKTGWTENAGECLISYIERDHQMIIVAVLNSYDRFGDTQRLVDWVYTNHQWEMINTQKMSKASS